MKTLNYYICGHVIVRSRYERTSEKDISLSPDIGKALKKMALGIRRLRAPGGLRFGESAALLFNQMCLEHALPHALARQKEIRMGRSD